MCVSHFQNGEEDVVQSGNGSTPPRKVCLSSQDSGTQTNEEGYSKLDVIRSKWKLTTSS